MKTLALRKVDLAVIVALSLIAAIVVTIGAKLVHAQPSAVSDLGAGWKCHKLPYLMICDRAA
jgi:hypothetical protein